jgi:hypothetical protein
MSRRSTRLSAQSAAAATGGGGGGGGSVACGDAAAAGTTTAAAAPSADTSSDASSSKRVDGCKARLSTLFSHEKELGAELSALETVASNLKMDLHGTCTERGIADCEIDEVKNRMHEQQGGATASDREELHARGVNLETLTTLMYKLSGDLHEQQGAVERMMAKREAVRAQIDVASVELDAAVNAPVSGGRDPTDSLPAELIVMIMLMLPFATLWNRGCERVCQRWAQLMQSAHIVHRKRDGRWAAYEARGIKPQVLEGHTGDVNAIVVGPDSKLYSASDDKTVRVWSGEKSGAHLQTLRGHTHVVCALAVGLNGSIYSASRDKTI